MRAHSHGLVACLVAGVALALLACDAAAPGPQGVLSALGIRHIAEVSDAEVGAQLADADTLAVQISDPSRPMALIPGARVLGRAEPVPDGWLYDGRQVLVLAPERELALREASRLSRAGLPRVAVFTGDPATLARFRTAARDHPDVQPFRTRDHPSR